MKTPTTLIIMDGFGLEGPSAGNAVVNAPTPNLDRIFRDFPGCRLSASGLDVGLPEGQMGNSEVGHTNMGAGRVVFQDLPHISRDIESGEFFKNPAYLEAMSNCREWGSALHLMGLLSDGGVHSHITHLFALLKMAKEQGLEKVYIHCFLDGRDVPPSSGKSYVEQLQAEIQKLGVGQIATVMGRYYAMDRDKRWDRVQKAYDAIACGEGTFEADAAEAVQKSYDAGVTDEFVVPVVCVKNAQVRDNDSIIFFNFRPDRAREIFERIAPTYGITLEEWNHDVDHVHMLFRAQPKTELSKFICAYKSASSRLLKKEFHEIRRKLWKEFFWSRSFCLLTTGGAPIEVIRRYIESQGQK